MNALNYGFSKEAALELSKTFGPDGAEDVLKTYAKTPEYRAYINELASINGFEDFEQQFSDILVELPEKIGQAFLTNPKYETLESEELKDIEYLNQAIQDEFLKKDIQKYIGTGDMLFISFGEKDALGDSTPDDMIIRNLEIRRGLE